MTSSLELISRVARSARKRMGFTQAEIARALGVSQATISRLESGRQSLQAQDWAFFCQMTQIPYESCVLGHIDRGTRGALLNGIDSAWAIPERYSQDRGSKVRANRFFLDFAYARWGEHKTRRFLEHQGFDPDFFVDYDNQLNYQFICDLVEMLISDGCLKPQDIPLLAQKVGQWTMQGSLRPHLQACRQIDTVSGRLAQIMDHLDVNFTYSSESAAPHSLIFQMKPRAHLEQFDRSQETEAAIARYRALSWTAALKEIIPESQTRLIQREAIEQGDSRWLYLILY